MRQLELTEEFLPALKANDDPPANDIGTHKRTSAGRLTYWNGTNWVDYTDTGSGTLQTVTDAGNTTDNDILIEASGDPVSKKLQVSANSGAALVEISAGRESGQDIAAILMTGSDAQFSIPTGVNLRIIDGGAAAVLTILADGSGTVDAFGVVRRSGTGSPEGVIDGAPGSTWSRINGSPGETFYIKQSGTGNTGWAPIA